jgi:hypothetical protein
MGQSGFSLFPAVSAPSYDFLSPDDDAAHRDFSVFKSFPGQGQCFCHKPFIHVYPSFWDIIPQNGRNGKQNFSASISQHKGKNLSNIVRQIIAPLGCIMEKRKGKVACPMYESVLYCDPQAARPAGFCPVCGGECYAPSLMCIRCERRIP